MTLIRIAKGSFDDDNLAASFKAIRDGVADAFGMKDNAKNLSWLYSQEKSTLAMAASKIHSVRIEIDVGDAPAWVLRSDS